MNSQELEIVCWLGLNLVVLIFNDGVYGMICWKQVVDGFIDYGMIFSNLDFVKYVEVYGCKGYEVIVIEQFILILQVVFNEGGVYLVLVLVDYLENQWVLVDELWQVFFGNGQIFRVQVRVWVGLDFFVQQRDLIFFLVGVGWFWYVG